MRGAFRLEDETKELEEKGFCNRLPLNPHAELQSAILSRKTQTKWNNSRAEKWTHRGSFLRSDCCCGGFFPNHWF